MSYTVLARRYRSTTFDEVIGQDHVARTLKRAIESDRVAHAYLFCGTRGVGKTSMARILAKALNCQSSDGPTTEPCGKCGSCEGISRGDDIDVLEIDAASNTQVEKTREVVLDNISYRPARSRFKIFVIDEVHMLSKSSFNALLKTLEEPPSHIKFILATTEAEKIPPTILSRCQRYDFRNIPTREIAAHLKEVVKAEKIKADDDALLLVAKAGAGSMRDALSLLDRLLSVGEKTLTVDVIEQFLGLPKAQLIYDLAQSIGDGDTRSVLRQADAIISGGMSADSLIAALVDHIRNLLILRTCGSDCDLVEVPGISADDLAQQAERFDAVALSQDIVILEELRRHIRQSQAGRALLDATLVRLSLADQFASIGELLSRLDGGGAGRTGGAPAARQAPARPPGSGVAPRLPVQSPAQAPAPTAPKKKAADVAPAPSVDPLAESPGDGISTDASFAPAAAPEPRAPRSARSEVVAPSTFASAAPPRPDSASPAYTAAPSPAAVSGAPAVSVQADFDLEDDDDLPRPGKVWDDSGPSLVELLRQQTAAQAPPAPAPPEVSAPPGEVGVDASNVEAVSEEELPTIWRNLLAAIASQGPGLHSLLSHGKLVAVEDGRAIIRYSAQHQTFVKMLDRNGKKDVVRDALTQVMQRSVGVLFEVDPDEPLAPESSPVPASGTDRTAEPPAPRPAPRAADLAPPPAAPAGPPPVKLTPELIESLRSTEPLIRSLMDNLGATIIKVERD